MWLLRGRDAVPCRVLLRLEMRALAWLLWSAAGLRVSRKLILHTIAVDGGTSAASKTKQTWRKERWKSATAVNLASQGRRSAKQACGAAGSRSSLRSCSALCRSI